MLAVVSDKSNLDQFFRKRRDMAGSGTWKEFAKRSGVAIATVNRIKKSTPQNWVGLLENRNTFAVGMGFKDWVELDAAAVAFLGGTANAAPDQPEPQFEAGVEGIMQSLRKVPSFDSVSAGALDERTGERTGLAMVPQGPGEFSLRVDGESMLPDYPPGALAMFSRQPGGGQTFNEGEEYVIGFTGGDLYFSRVIRDLRNLDKLILRKLNPDRVRYPDKPAKRSEIEWSAVCVGHTIYKHDRRG